MSSSEKPSGVPDVEAHRLQSTGATDEEEIEAARAANKFDIRRLIGALFCLYALILIALGIFGSHTIKNKADGVNVDLWTGLAMLVFGVLMIFWALSRPTVPVPPEKGSGRRVGAPATGQ
jgi:hypothetical protein